MNYFDQTFWKFLVGFLAVLLVVLVFNIAVSYYNNKMYGTEQLDQTATGSEQ